MAANLALAADISLIQAKTQSTPLDVQSLGGNILSIRSGPKGAAVVITPADREKIVVVYPVGAKSGAPHRLELPRSAIFSITEKEIVWFVGTGNLPGLNAYSLQSRQTRSIASGLRRVMEIKAVADSAYVITRTAPFFDLSRIDLANGNTVGLGAIDHSHGVVKFGNSGSGDLVLIDPASGEFRIDTLAPAYRAGAWHKVRSEFVDYALAHPPEVQGRPGVKMYNSVLLSHRENPSDGTHVFVLAAGQPKVGQYAIAVGADGEELRRYLLAPPANRFSLAFSDVADDAGSLGYWSNSGDKYMYEGVR